MENDVSGNSKNAIIVGKKHIINDGEQNAIFGEFQKVNSSINNFDNRMNNESTNDINSMVFGNSNNE